jgi:hypothetical protein
MTSLKGMNIVSVEGYAVSSHTSNMHNLVTRSSLTMRCNISVYALYLVIVHIYVMSQCKGKCCNFPIVFRLKIVEPHASTATLDI